MVSAFCDFSLLSIGLAYGALEKQLFSYTTESRFFLPFNRFMYFWLNSAIQDILPSNWNSAIIIITEFPYKAQRLNVSKGLILSAL